MHESSSGIGCLSGSITRVGGELTGSIVCKNDRLEGYIERVGERLVGSLHLVCTVNKDSYLHIEPDYVWLTPDMLSGEFDIYSNVSWKIE